MGKNISVKRSSVSLSYGLWRYGLTPKAIGLLYTILSLSDIEDWEFSVNGLVQVFSAAGTGKDAIQSGIAELEKAKLLIRSRVRAEDGTLGGSDWMVSDAPMDGSGPVAGFPAQGSGSPVAGFPAQADRPQYENHGREQEQSPVSPCGDRPGGRAKKGGRKRSGIELTPERIPATLAPVAEQLCHWWNTAKAGVRSDEALRLLIASLEQIRLDGGIEAVAEQIERAIEARVNGKGWQSISHRNWIRFAPPQQRQQAQERQRAMEPTGEQREILDLAARHPSLFQAAQQGPDGRVIVHFTHEAIEAATQARGSAYPASTTASIVSALEAEIAFLRGAMAHVQVGQGLDNCVCPF